MWYFFRCAPWTQTVELFAFKWEDPVTGRRQQYWWTVHPQGFIDSPYLFGQILEQVLEYLHLSTGLVETSRYVDHFLPWDLPTFETKDQFFRRYVLGLSSTFRSFKQKGLLAQTLPYDFPVHSHQPGDYVLIKLWTEDQLKLN